MGIRWPGCPGLLGAEWGRHAVPQLYDWGTGARVQCHQDLEVESGRGEGQPTKLHRWIFSECVDYVYFFKFHHDGDSVLVYVGICMYAYEIDRVEWLYQFNLGGWSWLIPPWNYKYLTKKPPPQVPSAYFYLLRNVSWWEHCLSVCLSLGFSSYTACLICSEYSGELATVGPFPGRDVQCFHLS